LRLCSALLTQIKGHPDEMTPNVLPHRRWDAFRKRRGGRRSTTLANEPMRGRLSAEHAHRRRRSCLVCCSTVGQDCPPVGGKWKAHPELVVIGPARGRSATVHSATLDCLGVLPRQARGCVWPVTREEGLTRMESYSTRLTEANGARTRSHKRAPDGATTPCWKDEVPTASEATPYVFGGQRGRRLLNKRRINARS
jgi:hypothetical protein